jgi:hypothetical protein
LRAVDRALGAVDIQDQTPRERAGRVMLHEVRIGRLDEATFFVVMDQ